jgi:acetolactate decarboxylase
MNHSGIYTHHTTSMHIHFMTQDKTISGHSDNMILGKNMILKLPKIK